jgi:transposase
LLKAIFDEIVAFYWGRLATNLSHEVRMIGPRKVKAFLQGQKTDVNDALPIAVAATQPNAMAKG